MFGCLFDLFGGWLIQIIWFFLSTTWEFAGTLWRRRRAKKSARRLNAARRKQQEQASPFARPAPAQTPPPLPPSQSPFAPAPTLTED